VRGDARLLDAQPEDPRIRFLNADDARVDDEIERVPEPRGSEERPHRPVGVRHDEGVEVPGRGDPPRTAGRSL